jgi:hypothetical protein
MHLQSPALCGTIVWKYKAIFFDNNIAIMVQLATINKPLSSVHIPGYVRRRYFHVALLLYGGAGYIPAP